MKKPGVGKIRGLQQIATSEGIFAMCAMDHRGSLQEMIDKKNPKAVGFQQMIEYKQELCAALAPHSSAVLLDPNFGAAQCIANGDLPGNTGLLVSMEATGYGGGAEGRVTELLQNWNAAKIRRMGGSAGKLLLYYRPDLKELAEKQLEVVKKAADDCSGSDLPFLVEPKTYPIGDEKKKPETLAAKLPKLVIDTARQITQLDVDVLKAEFPADVKFEKDEGKLLDFCQQLNEASRAPWVILSAGVDYETFTWQVKIACSAGASGFLGGRAVWQEAMEIKDKKERMRYLSTTGADRMKRLAEIAAQYGSPWYKKLGAASGKIADIPADWYESY
ncbi:MAG: tagatose 1,6-diphosphate aldolase [Dehalococcoidia bacterium]|nr:tagatose 1,6-diphosphate aldolase [Dehalococcoidia bacterium]